MMCYNCVCEKHPTSSFKEGECYICEFESTLANYQQSLGKARQHIDAERSLNQELQSKLDTIRKLVAGLPPTGEPVLVARWLIDDLKEAAK